ncbi:LutC/YkgG family protein [Nocardioides marmotae]|uniref:LutC/YkgG family protein n=1 Tax=Nocardioides marmotae TaxID=2663857 RepID=UPI0012B571B0|nr:lactate utilization protein C [Nocardioides marmotae]MBC9733281.1 lactate utilization protein C [Nocardioides marmotae]MTB84391.1 lactate utilization protein C [Nocardioides marmotae]
MTSAREEILGRVRTALEGVDRTAPVAPAPRIVPVPDLVGRFADRVEHYRAVVERCAAADLEGVVAAALARHLPGGAGAVVVPPGLSFAVAGAVVDSGLDAHELDRVDAVVTEAAVGIAETGTIVLDHGPGQGRRALTLVPDRHVCVVRADQVVPDVPDALARLDPARPLTFVSGPSATSDIELDRVEGVHGPRTLHVVVVEARTP